MLFVKAKMENWLTEREEREEWYGNPGNQRGYARNVGGVVKNAWNKCDDVENQGGNLGKAVEMTPNSSGNDKLKEWREIKKKKKKAYL